MCLAQHPCTFKVATCHELAFLEFHRVSSFATPPPRHTKENRHHPRSRARLAFVRSACSISLIRADVLSVALSSTSVQRTELFAPTSGLSLMRFFGISELRPNTSCIGVSPTTERKLSLASCRASRSPSAPTQSEVGRQEGRRRT